MVFHWNIQEKSQYDTHLFHIQSFLQNKNLFNCLPVNYTDLRTTTYRHVKLLLYFFSIPFEVIQLEAQPAAEPLLSLATHRVENPLNQFLCCCLFTTSERKRFFPISNHSLIITAVRNEFTRTFSTRSCSLLYFSDCRWWWWLNNNLPKYSTMRSENRARDCS